MATSWRPDEYGGPVVVSLLLHALVVLALALNLSFCERDVALPVPSHVRAVVLEKTRPSPLLPRPEKLQVAEQPVPVTPPKKPIAKIDIPAIDTPKVAPQKPVPAAPQRLDKALPTKPAERLPAEKPKPPPPDFSALLAQEERSQATREALRREAAPPPRQAPAAASARAVQDQKTVDEYKALIAAAIQQRWIPPPAARSGMLAEFRIVLLPGGELHELKLLKSSGDTAFDRAAENAIRLAGRLPVPADPALFNAGFRQFNFRFRPEDLKQ